MIYGAHAPRQRVTERATGCENARLVAGREPDGKSRGAPVRSLAPPGVRGGSRSAWRGCPAPHARTRPGAMPTVRSSPLHPPNLSDLPHRKHRVDAAHERLSRAMPPDPVRIFCVNVGSLFLKFSWVGYLLASSCPRGSKKESICFRQICRDLLTTTGAWVIVYSLRFFGHRVVQALQITAVRVGRQREWDSLPPPRSPRR